VSAGLGILTGLALPSIVFLAIDFLVAYVMAKVSASAGLKDPGLIAAATLIALPLLMQLSMSLMIYAVGTP